MSRSGSPSDLLVAGAGPAGLYLATRAARSGMTVTVVERSPGPPIDKACGEGVMPDGAARLAGLGLDAAALGARPFHGVRYLDGEATPEARFPVPAGRPGPPPHGLGVRRTRLHEALAGAAEAAGARIVWGTRVTGWEGGGDLATSAGTFTGHRLVAADGLRSPLRRAAGLDRTPPRRRGRRFGVRRHFEVEPWTDLVEVYWGDGTEAYVTPVGEREVGVAVLWTEGAGGLPEPSGQAEPVGPAFDRLLAAFPRLAARVAGAAVLSSDRGAGPLLQPVRGVSRDRLALLGDAAGYVDAITGEGLSLAFHEADALVDALLASAGDPRADLPLYEREVARLRRVPDALTRLLLLLERHPHLRRRAMRALAADPELFARLLGLHAGLLPLSALGPGGVARAVWRLATA